MSTPQQQTPGPNGPAAKRRRVEVANSTLRKPFRSPLLTRSLGPRSPGPPGDNAASPSLGIGQSPLRIKSRAGDADDEHGAADGKAPGESEEEDSTIMGGKGEADVEVVDDAGTDLQNPTSPSLRGSVAGGLGTGWGRGAASGNRHVGTDATRLSTPGSASSLRGQTQEGGLSNRRRYPSPSGSTTTRATAAAATPQRNGLLLPFESAGSSSSFQTPARKAPPPLFSSTAGTGSSSRTNPKTPAPPTNRTNTTAATSDIKSNKDNQDILTQLRTARKATQSRLAEAQKQLDLVRQAHRIQEKGSIDELIVLIEKWKCASRTAAEDLFELIRKRVDGMGGSRAWKDTRRRQQQRGWGSGFDKDDGRKKKKSDDDYGEYGDEEQEDVVSDDRDREEEGKDDEEEEEDTGFTMAMMLQSLNIDPQQLGWDPTEERWRD
ncbi:hypothetical protein V8F06_002035 [Rhypophila decipiens]